MPIILDHKQLEKLKKEQAKKRVRKPRTLKAPITPERKLRKAMERLWAAVLLPATVELKRMAKEGADPSRLADYIESVLRTAEFEYGIQSDQFLLEWKVSLDLHTRHALQAGLQHSLGVDVAALYDDPVIKDVLISGATEASLWITKIPADYLSDVAVAVRQNFTGQLLPEGRTLEQQIQHLSGVSYKRAKLIARDQTKKLTSSLNQHRQQSIGVEMYIWRTVKDERVVGRPGGVYPVGNKVHGNHFVMEGLYCKWSDSSVYSTDSGKTWKNRTGEMPKTHPGVDIQCRCHAEPVIDIQKILEYAQAA